MQDVFALAEHGEEIFLRALHRHHGRGRLRAALQGGVELVRGEEGAGDAVIFHAVQHIAHGQNAEVLPLEFRGEVRRHIRGNEKVAHIIINISPAKFLVKPRFPDTPEFIFV